MPTSLTQPIHDNPNFTFEQFAWLCSRSLMPCILLRDTDLRIPTPEDIEKAIGAGEVARCEASLREAEDELRVLESRSEADWEADCAAHHERRVKEHEQAVARQAVVRERFTSMLQQAEAWQPPTPEHEGLKQQMIKQCQAELKDQSLERPQLSDAAKYREFALTNALNRKRWRTEDVQKARARVEFKSAWFKALQESIPLPSP